MNYLAHFALSGPNEDVIMGNYSGDFIKGKLEGEKVAVYSSQYVLGLRLHRLIDNFTDTHKVVLEAKRDLHRTIGRAAGVAIDIIFDHYLARNFKVYYTEDLNVFAERMYTVVESNPHLVPKEMKAFSDALVNNRWLVAYGNLDGLDRTFNSMSRRYPFLSALRDATIALDKNYLFYQACFSQFYPEIQIETYKFLNDHGSGA
jgi:acyl carrier protein phosphodiesterase